MNATFTAWNETMQGHAFRALIAKLPKRYYDEEWDINVHENVCENSRVFTLIRGTELMHSTTDPSSLAVYIKAIIALEGK